MNKLPSFLDPAQYDEFNKQDRFIPRSIIEIEVDKYDKGKLVLWKLISYISNRLKTLTRSEHKWFECICITVKNGDGISWSAESVNGFLFQNYPSFTSWCLANKLTTDSMPLIADYVGRKSFLKLAVDNKLTTSFLTLRSWMSPLIIITAIIVGFSIKFTEAILKMKTSGISNGISTLLYDPSFYIIVTALSILGITSNYITTVFTTKTKSKSIENFLSQLEAKQTKLPYSNFIDKLAQLLQTVQFPRAVIIDNYESLDYTTKRVIERYFQKYSEFASGSEFWIIFEGEDGELFSNRVIEIPYANGYNLTKLFHQVLLTETEKISLANKIGKPDNVGFPTVKLICHGVGEEKKDLIDYFKEYRKTHPKNTSRYGYLEFLHLLSLTALPGNLYLLHRFLVNNLSRKLVFRSEILSQFLYGTRLTKGEFWDCLYEVRKDFKPMVIAQGEGDLSELRINPEITDVLTKHEDELQLENSKLGHLFWCHLWFDKLRNRPVEAFWVRKLVYHLLNCESSALKNNKTYNENFDHLFEIYLFAINACMKTCLFQYLMILLERSILLLETDVLQDNKSYQRQFLRTLWNVYSLLGNEEILVLILKINAMSENPTLPETIEGNVLEKLFYESISLSSANRILLRPDFFRYVSGQRETIKSISDYAKVRSTWFALIVNKFISKCDDETTLFNAVIKSDESLKELSRNAYQRVLHSSDESIRLTDILTLSLSLWCNALKLCPSVIMTKHRAMNKEDNSEIDSIIQVIEDFSDLIALSEDVVLLASEIKRESEGLLESSIGIDFLMNGLSRELCVISLSSILMAYNYIPKLSTEIVDTELLQRIEQIIEVCNDVIDYKIPYLSSQQQLESMDLIRTIDSLMKLCEVIWRKFDLNNLCSFMSIRRFHFNAICYKLEPDNYVAYKPLLESIGSTLSQKDFIGLVANYTIANTLKPAAELSSHYFCQGSQIALEGDFGDQLKNELSLISITQSCIFKQNAAMFMDNLLKNDFNKTNYIYKYLKSIPEESIPGIVLDILNASRRSNIYEINQNTNKTINLTINDIDSEEVKKEVKSLLEVFSIEEMVSNGKIINFSDLLDVWNERKEIWIYPWVLNILLSNGYSTDVVRKESLAILDHDPNDHDYNTYLFLAITLSEQLLDSEKIDIASHIPMSYTKNSINHWKRLLPAETNVRAYRILYQLDVENKDIYYSEMIRWESIKVHRDHLKRLPDLAKQGRFFLLFRDYFYSMRFWGLRTELTSNELFSHINVDSDIKRKLAYQWKSDGAIIPQPLIKDRGELVISSQYLYLGSYLFSASIDQDSNYNKDRYGFDKAASNSLYDLLGIIIHLHKLPKSIKELLNSHSRRLFEFTIISD